MRSSLPFCGGVSILFSCVALLSGCASQQVVESQTAHIRPRAEGLTPLKIDDAVTLKLKADPNSRERVMYFHRSHSQSFENQELRHQREETLEFTSQAETIKVDPEKDQFTQVITVLKKDGNASLRDFAMPEVGEKLEITADSRGRIIKSGDYPQNSIFYVPPVSLPQDPVKVGDTWVMNANWLSLTEMVPYKLEMVSILKGFWTCGSDQCAEIEVSGAVGFEGPLSQAMAFNSIWRGRLLFAMNAGTIVWARTESEEQLVADKVRRTVDSCLESVLIEPAALKLNGLDKPACEPLQKSPDTQKSETEEAA